MVPSQPATPPTCETRDPRVTMSLLDQEECLLIYSRGRSITDWATVTKSLKTGLLAYGYPEILSVNSHL